jgi:hypothetical protein
MDLALGCRVGGMLGHRHRLVLGRAQGGQDWCPVSNDICDGDCAIEVIARRCSTTTPTPRRGLLAGVVPALNFRGPMGREAERSGTEQAGRR